MIPITFGVAERDGELEQQCRLPACVHNRLKPPLCIVNILLCVFDRFCGRGFLLLASSSMSEYGLRFTATGQDGDGEAGAGELETGVSGVTRKLS
jgi:hypothetical protein